jgi:class 3 adenylate cyclase
MPLYMDIHRATGVTADDVAKAHGLDMAVQHKHGVHCVKYWFNESCGKIFCLIDAPNAEAADAVHRDAHGLLAEKIIEVDPDMAEGLLGPGEVNSDGAVMMPNPHDGRDPGIRSVLFTDIVGSTELTQRLGDEAAMEMVNHHDAIVRDALAALGGREVKHTGDGIMASFVSAVAAVRCASRIQDALARHSEEDRHAPILVRIGAAAGEPVEQRHDLFGSTVQLAARLCAYAKPSQILVSNVVAELCIGKGLLFEDLGEAQLKGFDHPVHFHAVRISG